MAPTRPCLLGLDPAALCLEEETSPLAPASLRGVLGLAESIRQARALAIAPDAANLQEAFEIVAAEEHEFAVISWYGALASAEGKHSTPLDTVEKYLDFRERFIGPRKFVREFAAAADTEFDKHADVMTRAVHAPDPGRRRLTAGQKLEAQKLLYSWVRAAYKHQEGAKFDVAQRVVDNWKFSKALLEEVEQIRNASQEKFTGGGFVVRPEIVNTMRLGSVSKHSEAEAVDIDWDANPQIPTPLWNFIEDFVGLKVVRDATRWKTDPLGLYRDVLALSTGFTQKVAAEVKRRQEIMKWASEIQRQFKLEDEIAKNKGAAQGVCLKPNDPPILRVLNGRLAPVAGPVLAAPGDSRPLLKPDPNDPAWLAWEQLPALEKKYPKGIPSTISAAEAYDSMFAKLPAKWSDYKFFKNGHHTKGFLTFSEKLVGLFHKHGFTWGVTFPTPDVMHFAKPKPATPTAPDTKAAKGSP